MRRLREIIWRGLFTALALLITLGLAAALFPRQVLVIDSGPVEADVLVVLGGGEGRAERAAELFRQGAAPRILITGAGDNSTNFAALVHGGVPPAVVIREYRALTTLENARFSVPLLRQMGAHRVILVTSWYHSRRALACFRHFAPEITFYSRPGYLDFHPNDPNRQIFDQHVDDEYIKLIGYAVAYGVNPLLK